MPKQIFCAECGTELILLNKALPKQQMVIAVIAPHTCPDEHPDYPFKDINNELITTPTTDKPKGSLDDMFKDFKFVKKTNDLNKPSTINPLLSEPGDKRDKDLLRPDSTAPSGILNQLKPGPGKD